VNYWPASSESKNEAYFQIESKGYRNTYKLDCAGRRFLWTENVDLSTGSPTDNALGAEWKPLSPSSTVSNAVYDAICRELLNAADQPEASTTGPSPSALSYQDIETAQNAVRGLEDARVILGSIDSK